jgi:tetratricopeptide (TPR) repeat protein
MRDKDNKGVLLPFKSTCFEKKTEDLFRILQKNIIENRMLEEAKAILLFIDTSSIECFGKPGTVFIEMISKELSIDYLRTELLLKFLFDEELLIIEMDKLILSSYGRVFLMSDTVSSTVDMIRYFWEKLDWDDLPGDNPASPFLHKDARRYVACLLSQINSGYVESSKTENEEADLCVNKYNLVSELLLSPVRYIIDNIFEHLGLIRVRTEGNRTSVKMIEAGRSIFEYYSYGMYEEYCRLIDDAWDSYDRGNFQEAYDTSISVMKVAGNIPEALNVIGCVHIVRNEYEKAEAVFKSAMSVCEDKLPSASSVECHMEMYISIYYNLGLCQYYMGRYINALHIFNSIRKTMPYNMENVNKMSDLIKKLIVI